MKKYKVKEVLKMLEQDGWYKARSRGDHRQYKHPTKPGTVTVRGKRGFRPIPVKQHLASGRVEITTHCPCRANFQKYKHIDNKQD